MITLSICLTKWGHILLTSENLLLAIKLRLRPIHTLIRNYLLNIEHEIKWELKIKRIIYSQMVTNKKGAQELWVVTNRIQKVYTGTQSSNEINFRIQAASTENLLKNSKCMNRPPGGSNGHYGGGHYGLIPSRPQSTWGGVFSDTAAPSYGTRAVSKTGSSTIKRETSNEDKLIFPN